jgi:tRNA pseudouridine38-40 synthase
MRRRIALRLEYDGTDFVGSQSQPDQRTVQDTLEAALESVTGERRRIEFAGRTDAGVHATGQVAALDTQREYSPATFRAALGHFLPEDVAVQAAAKVGQHFDPRRDAVSRRYRYEIEDGRERSPLRRHRAWQRRRNLDVAAMAAAVEGLPRELTDWAAFAAPAAEGYPTVRTLLDATVQRCGPHRVTLEVEADGFLQHQVRRMVGALVEVGEGVRMPADFAALVDGPPGSAGPTAPPQGLTLVAVRYPPGTVDWDEE